MPKVPPKKAAPPVTPIRKGVSNVSSLDKTTRGLNYLLNLMVPAPLDWIDTGDVARSKPNNLEPLVCEDYNTLIEAWKQAMVWTEGLDTALSVMLASCMSTMLVGDQLWVKIIGPASCGKSTLCEALSVNTEYVIAKSTIRGFHSGFGEGEHNLIDQAAGKTLIVKDGDTIIQSPGLGQILSEGRDLYDTVTRSSYRNKASKDHIGVRMTWILAGTSSLRQIDHSELGERFLDCVIMEGINSELEKIICMSAARDSAKNCQLEVTNDVSTRHSPEMALAYRLTAGYVNYLRKKAAELTAMVSFNDDDMLKLSTFAVFTSHMRARPSKTQTESNERELAARLTKQTTRLAMCLAAVMNKQRLDSEVMKRTKKVVMDTSRGDSLVIAQKLYASKIGMEVTGLMQATGQLEDQLRKLLRFLRLIQVVEIVPGTRRYKLTNQFLYLYTTTNKVFS